VDTPGERRFPARAGSRTSHPRRTFQPRTKTCATPHEDLRDAVDEDLRDAARGPARRTTRVAPHHPGRVTFETTRALCGSHFRGAVKFRARSNIHHCEIVGAETRTAIRFGP
jgi:hypothetical protein